MKNRVIVVLCCVACLFAVTGVATAQGRAEASINLPSPPPGGPAQTCAGFDKYGQPLDPSNFSSARTSDEESGFLVAEDSVDGAGTIVPLAGMTDGLRWWGINFDFIDTFCTDDDDAGTPFNLVFWDDAGGAPGSPLVTVSGVSPTISDTGIPFSSTTIKEYDASFGAVDITGASWVSIERQTGVAGCFWLWVDETLAGSYDDMAWQGSTVPSDQTMCVADAAPVPTTGSIGLAILMLLLLAVSTFVLYRRNSVA